ncbi:MAG: oxidoreductase [Lentisphaerae bacterium GWF2_45_14]|nr:MAG: oxidoreductase [Lentisphaerae bacterium GWF2_45_14]
MDEVRIGIIGSGVMGQAHMQSIKKTKRARLAAVCDMNGEAVKKLSEEHDVKGFTDANEMFKSGMIDAVMIATPHYSHTPLAVAAFDAKIHVLCEKPIAVHKADAEIMIEAHRKHPELKFAAMFNCRNLSPFKKLKKIIDSGEAGKIQRVNWIITTWFRSQAYYNSGSWRATWKGEGGGVLLNQCPHQLDLFQWLFGMPEKVQAFCGIGKYHNIEVEDEVTAFMEFKNGSTGIFITSTGEAPGTNRLEVTCERGRIVLENNKIIFDRTLESVPAFIKTAKTAFETPETWKVEVPVPEDTGSMHQLIIENFVNSIIDGSPLTAPGEEGIKSVELGNAMLYSAMKKIPVEMPLDGTAYKNFLQSLVDNSTFVKAAPVAAANDDFTKSFAQK